MKLLLVILEFHTIRAYRYIYFVRNNDQPMIEQPAVLDNRHIAVLTM